MGSQRIGAALDAPFVRSGMESTPDDGRIFREAINAFGDVAAAIGELREQDELLHLIARKVCELVDVARCSVFLLDPETGLYRGQVAHAGRDLDPFVKRLVCGTPADGFTSEIIKTRKPVVIGNVRGDPRPVRSAMRRWNVRSMMGVPMVAAGSVVGIVFLDSEDVFRQFDHLEQTLAAAFADLAAVAISQSRLYNELRSSHETAARQNAVLRRAAAVDEKLTKLVLDGCNLHEIAVAVAALTRKPCAIHDADGRRVAAAVPEDLEGVGPPRLLDPAIAARPEVAAALAGASGNGAIVGPFPAAGLSQRFLVTQVIVRDGDWGMLVLSEEGSRFAGFDLLIARRSATIVALELSAVARAASAEWDARSSLAGELIRGNHDSVALEARAEYMGVSLRRPHVLCLITGADDDDGEAEFPDARRAAAAFRDLGPDLGVLATEVAEGIVVIVEVPEGPPLLVAVQTLKELAAAACARLADGGRLRASLSTACRRPAEYAFAYRQAREVARCADRFGVRGALSADDLGAARLFLANTDPVATRQFAEDILGGLLDRDGAGELLRTLACFFDQDRNVRQSAAVLDVHENTIRYRLARIEELTGLAVASDSGAQLSAQLAVLILKLQNAFPAEDAATRLPDGAGAA
jgi:sugar diacid utilization regulator/putative methionine-R-sulfoxide reductase with GAF domain